MANYLVELSEKDNLNIDLQLVFKEKNENNENNVKLSSNTFIKLLNKFDNLMRGYYNGENNYPILKVIKDKDYLNFDKNNNVIDNLLLSVSDKVKYEKEIYKYYHNVNDLNSLTFTMDNFLRFLHNFFSYKNKDNKEDILLRLNLTDDNLFDSVKRVLNIEYDINEELECKNIYPSVKLVQKKYNSLMKLEDIKITKEVFEKLNKYMDKVFGVYLYIRDKDKIIQEVYVDLLSLLFNKVNLRKENDNLFVEGGSLITFLLELTDGYNYDSLEESFGNRNNIIEKTKYNYNYWTNDDIISNYIDNNEDCLQKFIYSILTVWFFLVYIKLLFF